MKITITIEDNKVHIEEDRPKLGGIKKVTKVGKVKKLSPQEKKDKKKMAEDEDKEMVKTLDKIVKNESV